VEGIKSVAAQFKDMRRRGGDAILLQSLHLLIQEIKGLIFPKMKIPGDPPFATLVTEVPFETGI
jgi:hypothetical protein